MIDSQDSQTVHIDALAHLLPRLMEASHNTRDDFDLEMIAYVNSCMVHFLSARLISIIHG